MVQDIFVSHGINIGAIYKNLVTNVEVTVHHLGISEITVRWFNEKELMERTYSYSDFEGRYNRVPGK